MNLHRIVIVVAYVLSSLLLPCPGFSGPLDRGAMQQRYNPAAESMLRVPGVVGMYEEDARAILQQSGLSVDVEYITAQSRKLSGKEFMVVGQVPSTGGVAMLGSSVLIKVYKPAGAGGGAYEEPVGNDQGQWGEVPVENPPAEDTAPPVEWGGSSPSGGGGSDWVPPANPIAPISEAQPVEPFVATPVKPTATQAKPREEVSQTTTTESKPSRPGPVVATPVTPTATQANSRGESSQSAESESKPSRPEPVVATQLQPTATSVTTGTGRRSSGRSNIQRSSGEASVSGNQESSGTGTVVATPVQQTATQATPSTSGQNSGSNTQVEGASSGSQATITMTPVNQTVQMVGQGTANTVGTATSSSSNTSQFRVTFNGFKVTSATDHETGDGKGDEVFIETRIFRVRKDGSVTESGIHKSLTMGSTQKHPNRVKAGTASKHGGLKSGDRFPSNLGPTGLVLSDPGGRQVPPMVAFDGAIDLGGEAVLIVTTIWEWDETNKRSTVDKWENWINTYMLPYVRRYPEKFLNAPPPHFGGESHSNIRIVSNSKYDGNYGLNPVALTRSDVSQTRPIKIRCDSDTSKLYFYPNILILNGRTGLGPGKGQMYAVSGGDGCNSSSAIGWTLISGYTLYAEVERLN